MTLSQLEYIIAIDSYRNFSLAAQKCLVTQPTLSMQVRKLEDELGVVLFDRGRQPVMVTDIGSRIVEQARDILREAGKVSALVDDYRRILEGELHIGIIPTIAPYLLPYFLGPFTKAFPEVHIQIEELKSSEIVSRLKKDMLDAGILATPLHEPGIYEDVLYYEEILLYINASHRLKDSLAVPPETLEACDMWMLSEGNCFRDHAINLCSFKGDLPIRNLKYESGSLETLKKMVDVEGGHTLLPELAVLELPAKELRRIRHFVPPVPLRQISLVYARSAAKRNLTEKLKNVITAALPEDILDGERGRIVEWS